MRERQVEFPPNQTHVAWLTPEMIGICLVCIVVVIILLHTKERGAFIGPWG
jgi:hypothetical protein